MILRALLALWTSVARPMGDHLWQSTLFLAVAVILVLALRRNQARVRYWVWLTTSVKFLIPFSLLIAFGSHLARPQTSTAAQAVVYSAVEDFSQPFAGPDMPSISQAPTPVRGFLLLPAMAIALWLVGIIVVLLRWAIGWVRISLMVRKAAPVSEGPEVDTLRRLESSLGVRQPIRLVLSPDWMEPGIFGTFRPVLIWPEGISKHLDDRHIEAILAHEVCHVRRHDNLTAVLHMLVEAVFWFHPLVWWMGGRLEEERERACDEEVNLLCNQPHVYAESILRVCKFCSESPLACVFGITGADLKKRIVQIMTERMVPRLTLAKKLLLATFGVCAVAAPIVVGLSWPLRALAGEGQALLDDWVQRAGGQQEFEVASVREDKSGVAGHANFVLGPGNAYASTGGRFKGTDLSLVDYIRFAYKLTDGQTDAMAATAPKWIAEEKFDVEARSENHNPTKDQMRLMMQSLLADRFKLKVHTESREMPVLAMALAKHGKLGPQLRAHPADGPPCSNLLPNGWSQSPAAARSAVVDGGYPLLCGGLTDAGAASVPSHVRIGARDVPLTLLVSNLGGFDRPLVDRMGLTGTYDFYFEWGADPHPGSDAPARPGDPGTTVEEALRDQLGIKLERQRAMVDALVIDHVEMPAPQDEAGFAGPTQKPPPSPSAPVLIRSVEPEFTERALQAHASGDVLVNLWVDEMGNPKQVRTSRGLGMGLDQKAIEAVRQYRFTPAMNDGKPVPAQLTVAVKFQIFCPSVEGMSATS